MEHQPHVWPTLLQTVIITVKMTMMMTITMITMIIVTIMMIASRLDFEPAAYLVLPRLLLKAASIWINIVAPVRQFSILGAAVRAPRAWCGLYTLVNRNNNVTSLYTCLSRKNYRNCGRH